jgi:hypothetical protein
MHAQMTVSPSPHAPKKCRQHGLTHLHRLDNSHPRIVELCRGPQGPMHDPTHTVSTRARFGLQQAQTPPKFAATSFMFLSRGLTCYTDVESNGRDAHPNPNRLPNVRPRRETHARADDGLSKPPCSQKSVASTVDILPQVDNSHPGSSNAWAEGPGARPHTPVSTCQDLASTSRNSSKICGHL